MRCLCNYQLAFVTLTRNAECLASPQFVVPSYLKRFLGYLTDRNKGKWDLVGNTQNTKDTADFGDVCPKLFPSLHFKVSTVECLYLYQDTWAGRAIKRPINRDKLLELQ